MPEFERGFIPEEELTKRVEKEKEPSYDAAIVFGGGPVEKPLFEKRAEMDKVPGGGRGWMQNIYAKMNTIAAAQAFQEGKIGEVFLTGGRTYDAGKRGPSEAEEYSEAQLMGEQTIARFKLPHWKVTSEPKARNTIENCVFVINQIRARGEDPHKMRFLFISNPHHKERVLELAKIFALEGDFEAASTLLERRDPRYKKAIEEIYSSEEAQSRVKDERRWVRGMREIPEYWLPQALQLEHPEDLKVICSNQALEQILQSRGITQEEIETDPLGVKEKLKDIPRKMPPEEWAQLPEEE